MASPTAPIDLTMAPAWRLIITGATLRFGTLLGKTAEELLGSAAIELADVPEPKTISLRDQANYPTTASTIVGEQHIELAISPVMSGDQSYLGVMVTFRDVTEQARQHEQSVQFESAIAGHAGRGREEADRAEQDRPSGSSPTRSANCPSRSAR